MSAGAGIACRLRSTRLESARGRGASSLLQRDSRRAAIASPSGLAALAGHNGDRTTCSLRPRRDRPQTRGAAPGARAVRGGKPARRRGARSRSRRAETSSTAERDDLTEAIKRLRGAIGSLNQEGRQRLHRRLRNRQPAFSGIVLDAVRGRARPNCSSSSPTIRWRPALSSMAQPPGKKAPDADPALGRRTGADRALAHLRGVPDQPLADLRARRSRRAAR